MTELYSKQLGIEMEMHGAGIARFEKANQRNLEAGQASETEWNRRILRELVKPMSDALEAYIDYYENNAGRMSHSIHYMKCLPPQAASYITIKSVMDNLSGGFIKTRELVMDIAKRIEDEVRFTRLEDTQPKYIKAIKEGLKKRASKSYKFEHDSMVHAERELALLGHFSKLDAAGVDKEEIKRILSLDEDKYKALYSKREYAVDFDRWVAWPDNHLLLLGANMLEIFTENMTLNGNSLIVKENVRDNSKAGVQVLSLIRASDYLNEWVEEYKEAMADMYPTFAPCVIPPRDWESATDGGYHTREVGSKVNLVKIRDKKHLAKLTKEQMPAIYKAVNGLQSVKWAINSEILEIAKEIRSRSLPLGMPSMKKTDPPVCPVPEVLSDLRGEELKRALSTGQWEEFKKWKHSMAAYHTAEVKRSSTIREITSTLDIATKYVEFDSLHFVYTLDFRSRFNAQSTYLTPQGGDLQKSLIRFRKKEKLGKDDGEFWFLVQGANVWGWDKEEFKERVRLAEAEEFQAMCLDIAADPTTFVEWTAAEKPWQFLSWCLEYAKLIEWKEEGNDACEFKSFSIVAMDGSCSGIQHYSGMLRDEVGGKEVNLVPSNKPQDIYRAVSDVALGHMEAIMDFRERDVPNWPAIKDKYGYVKAVELSKGWIETGVTRSLSKKPVMTMPYGSSPRTCYQAVQDYLHDIDAKERKKVLAQGLEYKKMTKFSENLDQKEITSFASSLVWSSIGEVVVAARAGMKFIKQVTGKVSASNKPLVWTTPTGFIVKQAIYVVDSNNRVNTKLMGGTSFRDYRETKQINATKMASSAAPNFIHSMDASHLCFAVNGFIDAGIADIAVIHDSFGTHACHTKKARSILNNTFVDMYQENDVIAGFKEAAEGQIKDKIDVELPEYGTLDLEVVRDSEYLFG
ncbi:DNA-directed RNA polymerase [Marinomonas phage CPP1m]|uniref:DNA-directed RNA polymerase n=2 Tax=Murciavirus CPP1m TaxID=2733327 RepID=A0A1W5S6V6_9CAUD|nr:DNA-directed RNA polymerase [Marinomonas phage CPP1m]ARB11232.1 DNA-directed RNA polymerase [Marinomonas phage CPP1m]ARB11282.1 DNA-directed RNA polymerase [Marinomonas phage CPG1g]